MACVFSGLSLNVSNLGGDVYLNFFLTSIAEIIGFLLCMPLLDRVGRKPVYIASLLSGGIALVLTIFPILYGQPGDYCLKYLLDMVSVLTFILCKQVTITYRKLLDMVKILTVIFYNQETNAYKNQLDMVHYLTVVLCKQMTIAYKNY